MQERCYEERIKELEDEVEGRKMAAAINIVDELELRQIREDNEIKMAAEYFRLKASRRKLAERLVESHKREPFEGKEKWEYPTAEPEDQWDYIYSTKAKAIQSWIEWSEKDV